VETRGDFLSLPVISLVAPCLNEEENVIALSDRFFSEADRRQLQVEIVFVDDGSTDNTWQVLEELSVKHSNRIVLVRHSTNRGIPQGWISGVVASNGKFICLIDSDLQNRPESVFTMYEVFTQNDADLIRGIRKPVAAQAKSRVIMSRLLNMVLNIVFGMRSKDNKSGFVFGPRANISLMVHHRGHYSHYQTFIGVAAHSRKFNVIEVDTPFEDRRSGISFISGRSFKVILQVLADIPEARTEFGRRLNRKMYGKL
jgi:phenylacetate-CoA ligase